MSELDKLSKYMKEWVELYPHFHRPLESSMPKDYSNYSIFREEFTFEKWKT